MSLTDVINGLNSAQSALNSVVPLNQSPAQQFGGAGFTVPATFQSTGNQLPYSQVPAYKPATLQRNIITWYVPQFGTVTMFVNPASISYVHKKLITRERTKGGFTLQYWGEDVSILNISGTTGSSGIEGINALYELYRAEQYAFDTVGLAMSASNAAASLSSNLTSGLAGALGAGINSLAGPVGGSLLGGILGLDSPANSLSPANIPSLASLAFTVEMYYGGWVFRGYFENMTINEQASDFLIGYQMTFVATQKRGYRLNYFPFTNSANNGPSAYATPPAFSGNAITRQ